MAKKGNNPFELQVLAPMYKGQAGINNLNLLLQNLFNPLEDRNEFKFNDIQFREGDKVLHLVNDAQANVFNGDLGIISELVGAKYTDSKQDEIIMDFDGQEVTYPRAEWYKITLAFAMSIHKSQGSEFSTVIVPMVTNYSRMLERNLLYTAITRAKQSLILLGEKRAFAQAVAKEGSNRKTFLIERFEVTRGNPQDLKGNEVKIPLATKVDESNIENKKTVNHEQSQLNQESVSHQEISLFEDSSDSSLIQNNILTEQMINSGDFDPLIGLNEGDFLIFN